MGECSRTVFVDLLTLNFVWISSSGFLWISLDFSGFLWVSLDFSRFSGFRALYFSGFLWIFCGFSGTELACSGNSAVRTLRHGHGRLCNNVAAGEEEISRARDSMKRLGITIGILILVGCGGAVKKRTQVATPPAYALAQVASLDELVGMINERYAVAESLSVSSLKVEFVGGSIETGVIEEYRSAKAYLVAKWPDSIFVNILNPLTSSTVIAMAAAGETFQIWIPGENKYLTGRADAEFEQENPIMNVRPQHLLEGILVERIPVDGSRYRYFLEET